MIWKNRYSGLDTETIGGYAVILSTEYRAWQARSFEECVNPLFQDASHREISKRFVLFNLKYDTNAILKYLPTEKLKEFDTNTKTDRFGNEQKTNTIFYDKYRILYIPNKLLRITKSQSTLSFFDIAQFYNSSLDDAAKKYLGDEKISNEVTTCITTNAQLQTDKELYWVFGYHKQEIMKYCKQDATLTSNLGEFLVNKITDIFGFPPNSLVSKTGIGKQLIRETVGFVETKKTYRQKLAAYPAFRGDLPAGKFAKASYHGGIFDCKRRGFFPKVTNIDISSAYPYAMVDMPNWSNGSFDLIHSEDEIKDEDKYGWVMVEFDYPLIPYTADMVNEWIELHNEKEYTVKTLNLRKFYPTGVRVQVVTLIEYRFLKEFGYLSAFNGGYIWHHDPSKHQYPAPFSWIQEVYDAKSEIKKSGGSKTYEYSLTKIAMNSAYGLTAQVKGMPAFTNFFYASTITATTRIQIARMLEEIGYDKYISIATDGILLEGHTELPKRYTQGGLGSWDVDYATDALILSNGIYQYTTNKGKKTASRGLIAYKGDLIQDLKDHKDDLTFYPDKKLRPVTFHQSLYWDRYSRDDMNRFVMTGRKINANSDTSKEWDLVSCFGDLLVNQYIGRRFTMEEIQAQESKE